VSCGLKDRISERKSAHKDPGDGLLSSNNLSHSEPCSNTPTTVTYTALGFSATSTVYTTSTVLKYETSQLPYPMRTVEKPTYQFDGFSEPIRPRSPPTPPPAPGDTPLDTEKKGRFSGLLRQEKQTSSVIAVLKKRTMSEITRTWTGVGPPSLDEHNTYDTMLASSVWAIEPPVTLALDRTTGIFQLPPKPTQKVELPVETSGCVVLEAVTTTVAEGGTKLETVVYTITSEIPMPRYRNGTESKFPKSGDLPSGLSLLCLLICRQVYRYTLTIYSLRFQETAHP
jgi:hypothetical protein